jgi:uncharacterized protein YlxW (UPF0749 family)
MADRNDEELIRLEEEVESLRQQSATLLNELEQIRKALAEQLDAVRRIEKPGSPLSND